jgi:bifunctional UDP-N-acetylglucosamine pyrophosphorylase/glucosamine-1-phosphate N-acetyltransferase
LSQLDLAVVLAAGEGQRMKSALPKVLHSIAGRSLLEHVMVAVSDLAPREIRVVVGAHKDLVTEVIREKFPEVESVFQEVRGGTGHALRLALEGRELSGDVLVCAGDTPLLTAQSLNELLSHHRESRANATVLTAEVPEPYGYGRVIRQADGSLLRIVEESDATEEERKTLEINSGVYLFSGAKLKNALTELRKDNSQNEEYLTDLIEIIRNRDGGVGTYLIDDFTEILGVNDKSQLAECAAIMRDRINHALMLSGVVIVDPLTTWIDLSVEVDIDVRIEPGTSIAGQSIIESGSIIGPRTTLIDVKVGKNASVIESYCLKSEIGDGAKIGPYSHLREGSLIASSARVGSFVELKNASIGMGSKVPHLSYVGDAIIGVESNIGAGAIFVNYDGVEKHQTNVGDHVRIGSDSMLIAPITIGDGAYTGAGSVITEDVPAGALGIGRAKHVNILGWVAKKRKGSKSAKAAEKREG